jgi:hypothetical protein
MGLADDGSLTATVPMKNRYPHYNVFIEFHVGFNRN